MNGLTLRVSSIRGNENIKKNSEMRMAVFQVPPYYKKSEDRFISDLSDSDTVEDQIRVLKVFADHVKKLETTFLGNIQILTNLYIEAPLKHPVKNTILKVFGQISESESITVLCLSKSILNFLDAGRKSLSNFSERNNIINSIGSCFENFKLGLKAVKVCTKEVLAFFKESLVLFTEQLNQNISPSDKSEICLFIHTAIRITISCINQFSEQIEKDNSVLQIKSICEDLLNNPEIPMDTKTNCGILITTNRSDDATFFIKFDDILLEKSNSRKLCLLNGVICTISNEYFVNHKGYNIFYKTAMSLKDISDVNAIEPSIILGVSRSLVQLTKKLLTLNIESYLETDHIDLKQILKMNLDYTLSHLQHHMDNVRHLCKELLKLTIQLAVKVDEEINNIIYDYIKNTKVSINTKCIFISSLCATEKAATMLRKVPNLIDFLLKSISVDDHANVNLHVNNCYEVLMFSFGYKQDKNVWFNKWFQPLLDEMERNEDHYEIKQTLETLMQKAIKTYPDIVYSMMATQNTKNFGLMLSSLGIAKKSGLFDKVESNELLWKNILSYKGIKIAMVSVKDDTRISALNLITECHKSTEMFSKIELDCILYFLETNVNVQIPSVRQKITNSMKTALNRFKAGFSLCIKKNIVVKEHYYYHFMKQLHQFCISNLFVGANYSRRLICFKLLIQLLQIMSDILGEDTDIWDDDSIELLLVSLNDSYEANKAYCMTALEYCPKANLQKYDDILNYEISLKLMTSVKPNDSITAAYYLEYLCNINTSLEVTLADENISEYYPKLFKTLLWCDASLQKGLAIAKRSLLRAAREDPLYGTLFCIRHLLNKIDFKSISKCSLWSEYITKLLHTCRELTKVVSIVVNNSSPEGHLPNDFSEIEGFLLDNDDIEMPVNGLPNKVLSSQNTDNYKTTPQMVLLCSWRVIKEVSLLLGDIAFESPVKRDAKSSVNENLEEGVGLIDCNQILDIGAHFTELLSETKHRGAFEQAYIGFSKLCIRLWGAQEIELHTLPMKWLNEMIALISGIEIVNAESSKLDMKPDKMCATRRSAGVPFMMQALITSELQVCSSKGLIYCMRNLVAICKHSKSTEPRTHSLNILRTLFRCTDLRDSVGEFISDGIICAINGYDAESWSERNSSTLLFSALMIRIFGVQRTRDSENLNIRNKMTGRIFFLRYPQLYDFFMVELKEASLIILAGSRSKKLHPLLLLLSRLYPSALEGSESNLKLSRFVPIVSTCSGCAELQTRKLAAKFIAIIVSPDLVFDRIFLLLDCLTRSTSQNINSNSIHGTLLQILYLIRTHHLGVIAGQNAQLHLWIELYTTISNYLFEVKHNFVIYGTILDILLEILARCHNYIFAEDDQILDDLNNIVDYLLNLTKQKQFYGSALIMKKLVLIKLIMFICNDKDSDEVIEDNFVSDFDLKKHVYDFLESKINIMLLILDFDGISNKADDFDLDKMETYFVQTFSTQQSLKVSGLRNDIIKSRKLHLKLKEIIESNTHYYCTVKAYTVLSYTTVGVRVLSNSKKNAENLKNLQNIAASKPNQLKNAVFQCFKRCFEIDIKNSRSNSDSDIYFLLALSSPHNSDELRLTSLEMLKIASLRYSEKISFRFYSSFSRVVLTLLRDDNLEIRNNASRTVTDLYKKNLEVKMEPVLASYAQKLYLRLLTTTMNAQKYNIKQIIAIILIVMANEKEVPDENDNPEYRVFDKNETNIYGESYLLKEYCVAEIQHLITEFEIDIDDHLEEILKIGNRYCPSPAILRSCFKDIQLPLTLIDVVEKV